MRLSRDVEDLLARLEGERIDRTAQVATTYSGSWQRILVVLDGSPGAEPAAVYAETIAQASGGCLILTCSPDALPDGDVDAYLWSIASDLARRVSVETAALASRDGNAIVAELERCHADLVVMTASARTRRGTLFHMSPIDRVLVRSRVPALVTRPLKDGVGYVDRLPNHPRLLVPLNTSAFAEAALWVAAAFAELLEGELVLVQALPLDGSPSPFTDNAFSACISGLDALQTTAMDYLTATARRVTSRFPVPEPRLAIWPGSPADIISTVARMHEVALVVMATHARTGIERLLRGSVAHDLLNRDTVPLLLLRPRNPPAQC